MEPSQALADLTEISSQIEAAVLFDESGEVAGSTLADEQAAASLARAADELLRHADRLASGDRTVTQVEASAPEGSVFVGLMNCVDAFRANGSIATSQPAM